MAWKRSSLANLPEADAESPPVKESRARRSVKTLPEQIADDLGAAIARGEYQEADRLLEQEISEQYGVSRGPIREAFRILAQRGLANLYPRRGAFVAGVSLDSIVDLFNVRAVLMSLAARYFASMATDDARAELQKRIDEVSAAAKKADTDASNFQFLTRRISVALSSECGSESLARLISHQNESSAWVTLWRGGRLDFQTTARRRASAAMYVAMGEAIDRRDGVGAEAVMRNMIMISREQAVAVLVRQRGEVFDERRMLKA